MNRRNPKLVAGIAVALLTLGVMRQSVFAKEPYEKISNTNEWEVLKIVNQERLADGEDAISMFARIQSAAGVRAKEIKSYFSHTRPDGTQCFTVLSDKKVNYRTAGENIAAGYHTPDEVMYGWMHSEGHRSNILNSSFSHIGIGYCEGGAYNKNWVQLFVGGCSVQSVAVNDNGNKNYPAGTAIDDMDRYLIVQCSMHGSSYVPVISQMCSGYSKSKTGTQTVTVRYQDKTVKMQVSTGNAEQSEEAAQSDSTTPAKVKGLKAVRSTKSTVTLSYKKSEGSGYQVYMATSKNGKYKKVKTVSGKNKLKCKITGLSKNKTYYFKVRAYKKSGGKTIYGSFSTVKSA